MARWAGCTEDDGNSLGSVPTSLSTPAVLIGNRWRAKALERSRQINAVRAATRFAAPLHNPRLTVDKLRRVLESALDGIPPLDALDGDSARVLLEAMCAVKSLIERILWDEQKRSEQVTEILHLATFLGVGSPDFAVQLALRPDAHEWHRLSELMPLLILLVLVQRRVELSQTPYAQAALGLGNLWLACVLMQPPEESEALAP